MRLKLTCKACRRNIEIEGSNFANRTIDCPNCGSGLDIPSNVLDIDQELSGFRIEKHLGSGSMGCVYLATQVSMDRKVALKVLPPEMTKDAEDLEHFFHEVRLLAKLDHPNIVAAFEAGEDSGNFFMAMTYIDGESLEDYVEREGPMDEYDSLQVIIKIADALKYAWEKHKILHRDIKPANIMVDSAMTPRLLDLGISKVHSETASESSQGFLVGTPHYMSPEQAKSGDDIDFRSDMYALGCTLYHMVTGEVPFEGDSVMEVLTKHALDPFPSPKKLQPDLSDGLVDFLHKLMSKAPDERYESWDALLADARRVRDGKAPKAAEKSSKARDSHSRKSRAAVKADILQQQLQSARKQSEPAWKSYSRIAAVVAGVALLIAALTTAYLIYEDRAQNRRRQQAEKEAEKERQHLAMLAKRRTEIERRAAERRRAAEEAARRKQEEESDGLQKFQDQLDELAAYEQEHPTAYAKLISGYETIILAALNTEYEDKAMAQAQRLRKLRDAAVAELMIQLDGKAAAFLQKNDFRAARAVYANYAGNLEVESQEIRNERIVSVDDARAAHELAAARNQVHLERIADLTSRNLLQLDFAKAKHVIESAVQENSKLSDSEDLKHIRDLVEKASRMDERILNSFRRQVGKLIIVSFREGKERLEIEAVEDGTVLAYKLVTVGTSKGRIRRRIQIRDLSAAELYNRLGNETKEELELLRGILAARGGRPDRGMQHCRNVFPLLAESLVFFMNTTGTAYEEMAEKEFDALLSRAGIEQGPLLGMIQKGRELDITGPRAHILQAQLGRFLRRYGGSSVGRECKAFLLLLTQRLAFIDRPRPDEDTVQNLIQSLETANGGTKLRHDLKIIGNGMELDLSGNKSLRHIDPLANQLIFKLKLANTSVSDISPLKQLPLNSLDLAGTPIQTTEPFKSMQLLSLRLAETSVHDLTGLAETQLVSLDLANTPVTDIGVLRDLPLIQLNLRDCQQIKSFAPLFDMSELKYLCIPEDHPQLESLRDLETIEKIGYTPGKLQSPERFWQAYERKMFAEMQARYGAELKAAIQELGVRNPGLAAQNNGLRCRHRFTRDGIFIDLNHNPALQTLSPLKGLPISELHAYRCGIFNLDPLRNAPLKSLSIVRNPVADLTPLAACPIEHIDIRNTKVTDFSIIADWPVSSVHISGESINNIHFLDGKQLTDLSLHNTSVRSLSTLAGMPLTRLSLSRSSISTISILKELPELKTLEIPYTGVKQLSYLKYCPIQHLVLEGCPANTFSVLRELDLLTLNCGKTKLDKLSYLEGKKLTFLDVSSTSVRSLRPLAGMPLRQLRIGNTKIDDLRPLADSRLKVLWINDTEIEDLSPLKGLKLTELRMDGCSELEDLSPLAEMKSLERLIIPQSARGSIRILRQLPNLRYLAYTYDDRWQTAAEFFARH